MLLTAIQSSLLVTLLLALLFAPLERFFPARASPCCARTSARMASSSSDNTWAGACSR